MKIVVRTSASSLADKGQDELRIDATRGEMVKLQECVKEQIKQVPSYASIDEWCQLYLDLKNQLTN